jgi:putative coproporphyrinogen dehydrogenase
MENLLDVENKSVYIHIPFCDIICSYCDFCKLYSNDNMIDKYLDELDKEIKSRYKGEVIETLYIGGGTPSSLSIKQLVKLFNIIKIFNKSSNIEFSVEGNFESTSYEKIDLYKKSGVNRLSFGIETTNNKLLKLLNRSLDKVHVSNIINYCRDIGIDNINLDLIYALPGEDLDILKKDLDYIISLSPKHISTYSLIIEEHTKLFIDKYKNIDEDRDLEMYLFIHNYLTKYGYNHYEISNYSKDGYFSRHNLVYWNNEYYYGFGLGASGYINNIRYSNTRSYNKYIDGSYLLSEEVIDSNSDMDYHIMLKLRLSTGINKKEFYDRYHINIEEVYDYSKLVDDGLLIDNINIYIPYDKWYLENYIISNFRRMHER